MKLNLLLIISMLISFNSHSQVISNGNFENWITDADGFLDPDVWDSSNMDGNGAANVWQDVGRSGSGFSVKFTAIDVTGIPIPRGGNVEHFNLPFSGSSNPTSLKGYWKTSNMAFGDYIVITVLTHDAGTVANGNGMGQTSAFVANLPWTAFDIPITYSLNNNPVTHVFITVGINAFSAPSTGDAAWVDDLEFDLGTGINEIAPSLVNLNVFNLSGESQLAFDLLTQSKIHAYLINSIGQEMMIIAQQSLSPGHHEFPFNTSNLPSGIYSCVISNDNSKRSVQFLVTN